MALSTSGSSRRRVPRTCCPSHRGRASAAAGRRRGGTGRLDREDTDVFCCSAMVCVRPWPPQRRRARRHVDDELALLVVHGSSSVGMDTSRGRAERMEQREQQLLTRFYRSPHDRTESPAWWPHRFLYGQRRHPVWWCVLLASRPCWPAETSLVRMSRPRRWAWSRRAPRAGSCPPDRTAGFLTRALMCSSAAGGGDLVGILRPLVRGLGVVAAPCSRSW